MSTFFLIHGAAHGAWCWDRVVEAIEARGHTAVATDQPGLGQDDTPYDEVTWESTVAKLEHDLMAIDGDVIVVGHSMGGVLVAQLCENHPEKIQAAVYLAATLPRNGESCLSESEADCSAARLLYDPAGVGLTPELIGTLYPILLYKDCPPDVGPAAMGKVRRQPTSVFAAGVSITEERENTVPRYYVETLRDLVITPGQQRAMYERRGVKHVYTLDTGHTAMYADPQGVANILADVSSKQG